MTHRNDKAAGPEAGLDAQLLKLEQQRQALLHEWNSQDEDVEGDDLDRYETALAEIDYSIAKTPAMGFADLQIKARVLRAAIGEGSLACADCEIAVVDSLVADIDRLAARAS